MVGTRRRATDESVVGDEDGMSPTQSRRAQRQAKRAKTMEQEEKQKQEERKRKLEERARLETGEEEEEEAVEAGGNQNHWKKKKEGSFTNGEDNAIQLPQEDGEEPKPTIPVEQPERDGANQGLQKERRRRKKGKFVLEVEFEPEAATATKLSNEPVTTKGARVRMSLDAQWKVMLERLKNYKTSHGHCRVPRHWKEDVSLGNWVRTQRHQYIQQRMSDERRLLLEKVGFEFVVPQNTAITWEECFAALSAFKEKNGHCDIPTGYDDPPSLQYWTFYQREMHIRGKLNSEEIAKLDSIGFTWDHKWPTEKVPAKSLDEIWQMQFEKLARFKEEHGHCSVPSGYSADPKFARWTETQRTAYRRGQLIEERVKALETLSFEFRRTKPSPSPPTPEQQALWKESFEKVKLRIEQTGHCNFPTNVDPALVKWIRTQRTMYRRDQLIDERKAALESIGFDFMVKDPPGDTPHRSFQEKLWNTRFDELKAFKAQFGHCRPPEGYDSVLHRWVGTQRTAFRRGQMPDDRVQALEELGFEFRVVDGSVSQAGPSWEEMFERLKALPAGEMPDLVLARWMNTQRSANRAKRISEERKQALDSVSFDWEVAGTDSLSETKQSRGGPSQTDLAEIWNMQFEKLKVYKMANGSCNVPSGWAPDPVLARWVCTQRTVHRRNQMHDDRKTKLEAIGFEWRIGPRGRSWEESFQKLKEFKESHGHCHLPSKDSPDPALSSWIITQRQKFKKDTLPAEQMQLLESIGFAWTLDQEKDILWNSQFEKLRNFQTEHGHCGIPSQFPEDPQLLDWISEQHRSYFASKLPHDHVEKLISIGFIFNNDGGNTDGDSKPGGSGQRTSWRQHFEALKAFKEAHGHTHVPASHDARLAKWANNQRTMRSKGQGPTEAKINQLTAMGFDWSMQSRRASIASTDTGASESASTAAATPERGLDLVVAAATAAPKQPLETAAPPTVRWARNRATNAPGAQAQTTMTQQGVQQMAVRLEVERAKLDAENKQLKRANQKLQAANQNLTKRLDEVNEKMHSYDEQLKAQAETLETQGQQIALLRQEGPGNYDERLSEQAEQLTQLAAQVQEMRQSQYTLQHQVGLSGFTYRL